MIDWDSKERTDSRSENPPEIAKTESRSFKARLTKEVERITEESKPRKSSKSPSGTYMRDRPKETTLNLTQIQAVSSPIKGSTSSRSFKSLKSDRIRTSPIVQHLSPSPKPVSRPLKQNPLPKELRKLYELMKGASPISVEKEGNPRIKEVRELSASPMSDLLTSCEIAEVSEELEEAKPGIRMAGKTRTEPDTMDACENEDTDATRTVAVYTSKGLRVYELRRR